MNDRDRLLAVIHDLDLPPGQWFLCGSGVLVMHGLRDHKPMGDIDIFLATRPWFDLYHGGGWELFTTPPEDADRAADPPYLYRTMYGIEVNVFFDWRTREVGNLDINWWLRNAEEVEGVPCTTLEFMLDWKLSVMREKDLEDISAIQRYLREADEPVGPHGPARGFL